MRRLRRGRRRWQRCRPERTEIRAFRCEVYSRGPHQRSSSYSRLDYVPRLLGSLVLLGYGGGAQEIFPNRADVAVDFSHTQPRKERKQGDRYWMGTPQLELTALQ